MKKFHIVMCFILAFSILLFSINLNNNDLYAFERNDYGNTTSINNENWTLYVGNFFEDVIKAVGEGVKQGINEGLKSGSEQNNNNGSEIKRDQDAQQEESIGRQRKSITDMSTEDSTSNANPSVSSIASGEVADVIEFDVPLGKTVNGFTYTQSGILLYKGKALRPSVMVNADYIEKYHISILRSKDLAAAIAVDDANKHELYLIDMSKGTSNQIPPEGISTAVKIYWSPSQRYMVALCWYEGNRFISIDLNTNKINDGDFIGPPNKAANKIWHIKDMPRWIGTTDVLGFTMDEICNYYDNPDCGDKVLATYNVRLDAATLKIQFDKVATNTELSHNNIGTGSINVRFPLLSSYMEESNISLKYCDKNTYLKSKRNIHNGIDISVPSGQSVQSICAGKVVLDHTTDAALSKYSNYSKYPDCRNNLDSCKYWNSFLIVEHNCDGQKLYAYYGHVNNRVANPKDIKAGDQIAVIRHDKSGVIPDHLHLSISTGKDWNQYGWGYDLSCKDADAAGYKDPLKYLNFTEGSTDNPEEKRYEEIAAVGKPAPAFELKDANGNLWKLSDLRGKVVFLNFWATWCVTCKSEAPYKEALFQKMLGKPFQMLGVLFRDDPGNLPAYYRVHNLNFPALISPGNEAAKSYGITGVPETFIIDKNGIVREKIVGPLEWSNPENIKMIEKYL